MTKTDHSNKEGAGLKNRLMVITSLVFILPFLIFTYIFYKHDIALDFIQTLMVVFILLMILGGLVILRQIFDKILTMARLMKKAVVSEDATDQKKKGLDEVQYLTDTFEV